VSFLVAVVLVATVRAADPAEAVLKGKDLRRAGTTYVLPLETELQKKLKEANSLYKQVSLGVMQQRAFAHGAASNKAMIQELTQRRIMLNQQLRQAVTVQQNNQVVAMLNEVSDTLQLLHDQTSDPEAKDKINAEVGRRREAFVEQVLELRKLVDEGQDAYKTLADDAEVKQALTALNQKTKTKLTLGPSRTFLANVKLVGRVEATVLTESINLRKKGGIYWLDVTFNGKVTRPMAFDTGASSVVLPADLAASIGLKPGKDDPTVQAHVADGSIVEAKQMTIPSVRVGKFTVNDVVCIIMPADKQDVAPLLGQTFLKNFTHRVNGETGTLVLTQVETPEAEKPAPRTKAATRPARTNAKRQAPVIERTPDADSPR
jgi:clan AA aspartic protease (TIGR02281 family)